MNELFISGIRMLFQKLISGIKIGVFFLMMIAINTYSMDLAITLPEKKKISFKSLEGMPCLTFRSIAKLSPEKIKNIQGQMSKSKNKDLKVLFDIATKLPPELQKLIILKVFDNNDNAANKFLNMPLVDAFNLCDWSQEILKSKYFTSLHKNDSWRKDIIFEVSDGIAITLNTLKRRKCLNYKELKSVKAFCDKFGSAMPDLHPFEYRFCETYSLKNFMKRAIWKERLLLPVFLAPFIAKWINLNVSPKILSEEIIRRNEIKNEIKEVLNLFVKNKFDQSGDSRWLDYILPIENPCVSGGLGLFMEGMPLLMGSLFFALKAIDWTLFCSNNEWIYALIGSILHFAIFSPFAYDMFGDKIISPELWIAGITASYVIICSLLNIKEMREIKTDTVKFKDISELLLRDDIKIL